jgi:chromosome segregation ATPase
MLEAQLTDVNDSIAENQAKLEAALYDQSQKDDEIKTLKNQLDKVQKSYDQAQRQTQAMKKTATEQLSQNMVDKDVLKKAKMTDSLQRELHMLQQQMSKKSSAAQRLLQEREKDCKELKKRNKLLSQELDKGSFSDRKIFELAEKQSNRESVATAQIQTRNAIIQNLNAKLEKHDNALASAEYTSKQIEGQVEELCRIHRREDVNLDYLKSTVVQYLSKPPGSSERNALLPVLATLLQFDAEDYKLIEQGKTKVSWFGSVLPTIIGESTGLVE